jgi:hypothetical protein
MIKVVLVVMALTAPFFQPMLWASAIAAMIYYVTHIST